MSNEGISDGKQMISASKLKMSQTLRQSRNNSDTLRLVLVVKCINRPSNKENV